MDRIRLYTSLIISLLIGIALAINIYFYQKTNIIYLSPGEEPIRSIGIVLSIVVILLLMIVSFLAVYFGTKQRSKKLKEENKV